MRIGKTLFFLLLFLLFPPLSRAQSLYPLLPKSVLAALAQEISGAAAKRNLEFLARHNRIRGSREYHAVAEFVADRLREYGLEGVEILRFPADVKTLYGTQKARPAWDADFAELWELRQENGRWVRFRRIGSFTQRPITLAEDSESGQVTADLVDVGPGRSEADYAGKKIAGKLVLTSSQPGAVQHLAVDRFGAAGILSYAQNQKTAWWKENENLVRWGHLDSFAEKPTFGFMISLKQAREYRERLQRGERVRLEATVRAGRHPGYYEVVTAVLPGADAQLREEEIAYSCHMDHQRPGANDNASGSVTILEVARTLSKLIREGRLKRPARSIRFFWPPEIEGTLALLNRRPEFARRIQAVIHMDMVGGGPITGAIFHVTRGPASLPSIINDVAEEIARFVNAQTAAFAGGAAVDFPLVSSEGGKQALQAELAEFTMGSDHEIYTEGSFRIPAIYLNDWPDRFIHTNFDRPANIDPTKLKRAGFIGAAAGYFLADVSERHADALFDLFRRQALRRTAQTLERRHGLSEKEGENLARFRLWFEGEVFRSMERFFQIPARLQSAYERFAGRLRELLQPAETAPRPRGPVYRRNPAVKGTISAFGYSYLRDHLPPGKKVRLLSFAGLRGGGEEYAYEVLNFIDGRRSAGEIRDLVSAVYGPVPEELVEEYLSALAQAGMIERVK